MKAIDIDFDYLLFAYQDASQDNIYYLDTEYGSIRLVHRELNDLRDLTDEIELSHNQFLYIPKASKEEVIGDLRDFMTTVDDSNLAKVLEIAFESPMILDNFKKIIAKDLSAHQRLEFYLKEKAKQRLIQWLNANALTIRAEQGN